MLRIIGLLACLLFAAEVQASCSGCSCRGGPGFRASDGKCVGWKELNRKCGNPPEARCTDERDGKRHGKSEKDDEATE